AFLAGGRADELVAFVLERHPQRVSDGGFVVYDKDAGLWHIWWRPRVILDCAWGPTPTRSRSRVRARSRRRRLCVIWALGALYPGLRGWACAGRAGRSDSRQRSSTRIVFSLR